MMGWYHDGLGWGGWLAMVLAMVVFWGLVIAALIVIFRGGRGAVTRASQPDPLEILTDRFARGEIDADEYQAHQDMIRAAR